MRDFYGKTSMGPEQSALALAAQAIKFIWRHTPPSAPPEWEHGKEKVWPPLIGRGHG